jgi:hypothetical protein
MTPLPCPRCLMWTGTCEHPDPTARLRDADGRPAEPGDDSASVEGWRAMMAGSPAYTPDRGAAVPCPGFVPMETT